MKSHSCRHQLGLAPGQRAIYALPDALLHNLFGLLRIALLLTQMIEQSFPLAKLRIVENRILNDLIALILCPNRACLPFLPGGLDELPQRWIKQRRLRVEVEDRRRRPFQTQRKSPRSTQPRPCHHLRDVLIARFVIRRKCPLLVGSRSVSYRAVADCKLDHALERQRFGSDFWHCWVKNNRKHKENQEAQSRFHLFTFETDGVTENAIVNEA